jgi:hypothetical protein
MGSNGFVHLEDVPDNDLIVAAFPAGERRVSPTFAFSPTQFSPSEPVSESVILPVTLPGRKKKNQAFASADTEASNKPAKNMARFIFMPRCGYIESNIAVLFRGSGRHGLFRRVYP